MSAPPQPAGGQRGQGRQGDETEIRNALRDLFALLGIGALVQVGTVSVQRSIVISPLTLGDARRLVEALDSCERTQSTPGRGYRP
ncbi:hypothetical protein D7319_22705 [Streptomyces radicis]|uniref:Uncharacterized protein n=1 Tax=Streptomyces radicis TaxID=1750517 RepID=A0A3A9WJM8_9ACTN|nr:hypothetical protein D7319_22705 [Streptomyces radicis]RKN18637.1 hypothetical protein D7318_21565 [Streptomyces radicis]